MSSNRLSLTARDACISIVNHYSDLIHHRASSFSNSFEDCNSDDAPAVARRGSNNDAADQRGGHDHHPYFDAVLGRPIPDLPPVGGFWCCRLLIEASSVGAPSSRGSTKEDATAAAGSGAARELLARYESAIHPCVERGTRTRRWSGEDRDGSTGEASGPEVPLDAVVEVLMNYELFVAHLIRVGSGVRSSSARGGDAVNDRLIVDTTHIPLENFDGKKASERAEGTYETSTAGEQSPTPDCDVRRVAATIADDVIRWSAARMRIAREHRLCLPHRTRSLMLRFR